ncbi:MAG: hypothetical protein IKZ35_02045 [Clostridia bacterium]|nr:hypothetical protein [Clostridia bacterium]
MKETIYTIPVNEVFIKECFCPFCSLFKRLEEEEVKYALGPAMMEPDYRAVTNEKGFCERHMHKVNALPKALALSLVIESHFEKVKDTLKFDFKMKDKKPLFKKSDDKREEYAKELKELNSECAICSKINRHFLRYVDTFVDMLKDKEFLEKVKNCDGFCMPHYEKIIDSCVKKLSKKDFLKIGEILHSVQMKKFEKYESDIKTFIESFDYKNAGKPCIAPGDTVLRASQFLNGEFEKPSKKLEDV